MVHKINLDSLSLELLDQIMTYLPLLQDQLHLFQTSKKLHQRLLSRFYSSWRYNRREHSFKSLYCFLRTIAENPDIAAGVQTLDLQEWDEKPEEWTGYSGGSDYEDGLDSGSESGSESGNQIGEDTQIEEHASDDLNIPQNKAQDLRSHEEVYDASLPLFKQCTHTLDLPEHVHLQLITDLESRIPDALLCLLLFHLPGLKTLYLVIPEEESAIINIPARNSSSPRNNITNLPSVESIYICSSLTIGIKGHRVYDLPLDDKIVPLFHLPSLHSLYTLTTTGFNPFMTDYPSQVLAPVFRSSTITSLSFDESQAPPKDILSCISLVKELRTLRWSQNFQCFSPGSCITPFYPELLTTLRGYKELLEVLDLDLRIGQCRVKGHVGNPSVKEEELNELNRERWTRDGHIIGSMNEFERLRVLKIDPVALCGDGMRGVAREKLMEVIPQGIRELELRFSVGYSKEGWKSDGQVGEMVWIKAVEEWIREDEVRILQLKVANSSKIFEMNRDVVLFEGIKDSCRENGVKFSLERDDSEYMTTEKYFLDILPTRRPGRDF